MKHYYVYILECADGTYYVGVTNDLERRLYEHQNPTSYKAYTASRLPVSLVYFEIFPNSRQAIAFEKQIKKWSAQKKKALIENNWHKLKELAQCRNETHYRRNKSPHT